jgi:hypothetical protein
VSLNTVRASLTGIRILSRIVVPDTGAWRQVFFCVVSILRTFTILTAVFSWHHEVIKGIPEERPELITGTEEVGDILVLALTLEKGGFDFYTKAHEIVKDQKAAQTFQTLAHVEARHMKRLYVLRLL